MTDKQDVIVIVESDIKCSYYSITHENDVWYQEFLAIIEDPNNNDFHHDPYDWFNRFEWRNNQIQPIADDEQDPEYLTEKFQSIGWSTKGFVEWMKENMDTYNIVHTIEYIAY